jgi:KipI family sensor histidine kinase inhibitor
MTILPVSGSSLIISFGDVISQEISLNVQKAYKCITLLKDENIIEITPSYATIFISFNIFKYDFDKLKKKLIDIIDLDIQLKKDKEIIQIDVYYGLEVGLDLELISKNTNLSIKNIIKLHSQKIYDVYAIGFLAGFGFLGEVDKKIATKRLKTPRKKILKGSVGIANNQSAVYPQDSPGGWNIIGRTNKILFANGKSPLKVGKKVQFNPITKEEFLQNGGTLD